MDYQEETRLLREQITALQWGLVVALNSCYRVGEKSKVDEITLERIQLLKKAVQNLNSESIKNAINSEQ